MICCSWAERSTIIMIHHGQDSTKINHANRTNSNIATYSNIQCDSSSAYCQPCRGTVRCCSGGCYCGSGCPVSSFIPFRLYATCCSSYGEMGGRDTFRCDAMQCDAIVHPRRMVWSGRFEYWLILWLADHALRIISTYLFWECVWCSDLLQQQ